MGKVEVDIKGYRQLTKEEQELINMVKDMAEEVGEVLDSLERREGVDKRWLAIGRTDLQKGFMGVIRSVAKPTTF